MNCDNYVNLTKNYNTITMIGVYILKDVEIKSLYAYYPYNDRNIVLAYFSTHLYVNMAHTD
jgi:hypothetical protein